MDREYIERDQKKKKKKTEGRTGKGNKPGD
jgi:hypothetical protein